MRGEILVGLNRGNVRGGGGWLRSTGQPTAPTPCSNTLRHPLFLQPYATASECLRPPSQQHTCILPVLISPVLPPPPPEGKEPFALADARHRLGHCLSHVSMRVGSRLCRGGCCITDSDGFHAPVPSCVGGLDVSDDALMEQIMNEFDDL